MRDFSSIDGREVVTPHDQLRHACFLLSRSILAACSRRDGRIRRGLLRTPRSASSATASTPATRLGPIVSERQYERVMVYSRNSVSMGRSGNRPRRPAVAGAAAATRRAHVRRTDNQCASRARNLWPGHQRPRLLQPRLGLSICQRTPTPVRAVRRRVSGPTPPALAGSRGCDRHITINTSSPSTSTPLLLLQSSVIERELGGSDGTSASPRSAPSPIEPTAP